MLYKHYYGVSSTLAASTLAAPTLAASTLPEIGDDGITQEEVDTQKELMQSRYSKWKAYKKLKNRCNEITFNVTMFYSCFILKPIDNAKILTRLTLLHRLLSHLKHSTQCKNKQ